MIPHLFFYPLAVLGLLWLCVMLHAAWPSRGATAQGTLAKSIMPRRQRAKEPKPFAGLTHKPSCALCEHETAHRPPRPPVRPDPMPPTTRRPRQVDTFPHFCPHAHCASRGWLGLGNLRANGPPHGGPGRPCHGTACQGYFPEPHDTILHGKRGSVERLVRVLACLAEGLGMRAAARVFEVAPNTVLGGLVAATEHLQALSRSFLCEVHVRQGQLDELYAVLRGRQDGKRSQDEASQRLDRSPQWVWAAIDPESTLLLTIDVGDRTLAMAQRVVHQVVQGLAPGCVPLFLTDGLKEYTTALLTHCGQWVQPPRQRAQGPAPKPRWVPLPQLL